MIPVDEVPKLNAPVGAPKDEYEQARTLLRDTYPGEMRWVIEGVDKYTAKKWQIALTNPRKFLSASVRSGKNLPANRKGPAAVMAGYGLSAEQIEELKGKSK